MKILFYLFLLLNPLLGCTSVPYIVEAGYGQLKIFNRAIPVEEYLKKSTATPQERKVLGELPTLRQYMLEIGLKKNSNYHEYVPLDQPYVTYVVTASDPLAFKASTWKFPIVGSFNYIGFHKEKSAKKFAEKEKLKNLDVSVRGARAYSMLGWFPDPLLSSMILEQEYGIGYFVNTIIHETLHVTVYVNGQSYFNESLADFFAEKMTPDYLKKRFGEESTIFKSYLDFEKRGQRYQDVYHELYEQLKNVYENSELKDSQKLEMKAALIKKTQEKLKTDQEINNASLIQYKTYGVGEAEFKKLYEFSERDSVKFIQNIALIKEEDFPQKHAEEFMDVIDSLIGRIQSRN